MAAVPPDMAYTPHFRDEDPERRRLNCHHKNTQFVLGKMCSGFGGNDKGRNDVQRMFRNVQEKNSGLWREPRQLHFCGEVMQTWHEFKLGSDVTPVVWEHDLNTSVSFTMLCTQ